MAGQGIEPGTSGSRVRRATDCAMWPNCFEGCKYVVCLKFDFIAKFCRKRKELR